MGHFDFHLFSFLIQGNGTNPWTKSKNESTLSKTPVSGSLRWSPSPGSGFDYQRRELGPQRAHTGGMGHTHIRVKSRIPQESCLRGVQKQAVRRTRMKPSRTRTYQGPDDLMRSTSSAKQKEHHLHH
ncbi:hypothetical protein NPIL_668121 [Nephila pilipes]|uniref:Uncharacterized protein n=1 Tax=Nephila pilipes TaxID=299642 RepID=A0A8X6QPS7_NEPPI|nr:hypothetical protein NPIL_668121 [Nephila pilipes]